MRVESAEAAERARQQALIEQQRLAQEMELRRAEVAKKRPTWMVAVTIAALIAAVGLVVFAVIKMRQSAEDSEKAAIAQKDRDEAVKAANEAQEKVNALAAAQEEMINQINSANAAVKSAQTNADRAAAESKLAKLQQAQAEMQERIKAAKDAAARAERLKGVKISKECLDNPLAKGCQ
jgi:hypothetical protein